MKTDAELLQNMSSQRYVNAFACLFAQARCAVLYGHKFRLSRMQSKQGILVHGF